MKRYIELLRLGYSEGPARVDTVDALVESARLYGRFFYLWKALSFFQLFPTIIPEIFVCEKDSEAIGVISICRRGGNRGPFYLLHTTVDPLFWRRGIASRLYSHFEDKLDPQRGHRVLTKVREENIPQIKNREKSGFSVYAREMQFSLNPDFWSRSVPLTREQVDEDISLRQVSFDLYVPGRSQILGLKIKETPKDVRDCDPAAVFPYGRHSGLSGVLAILLLSPLRWKSGIAINGQLAACGSLVYHRLQKTLELDLSSLPGAKDAVDVLLQQLMQYLSTQPKIQVNTVVNDYQEPIIRALKDRGFSLKDKYLLFCRKV